MTQLDLLTVSQNTVGGYHTGAGATEIAAAEAVTPRTGVQREAVYEAIRSAGYHGRTGWELAYELDMLRTSVSRALTQLKDNGWIVDSGRTRVSPYGSANIVFTSHRKEVS